MSMSWGGGGGEGMEVLNEHVLGGRGEIIEFVLGRGGGRVEYALGGLLSLSRGGGGGGQRACPGGDY